MPIGESKQEARLRIIGVDPGLTRTGYSVLEVIGSDLSPVTFGIIRGGEVRDPLELRLRMLYDSLGRIIAEHRPEVMALEDLYLRRIPVASVVALAQARGVICLAAANHGLAVYSYGASQVKVSLVGHVQATKEQVQRMVKMRLGLKELPMPQDAADALAVALCHWSMASGPVGRARAST